MSPDPITAAPTGASEAPDPLVLESFLWGLLSASSLNIGSIIGVTCLPKRKARAVLMAFGGGALLFALSVELFGHVLHKSDTTKKRAPVWIMEGSAVFGGLLFAMLNRFLNGMGADYRKASTSKGRLARMRAMLMRRLAVRLWNVPFFSSLSLDELKDLIQYAMYKERFNPGDIIMSETHESGIYFIISGMVRLQVLEDQQKHKAHDTSDNDSTATPYTWDLGPNHIFGDMTVLTGSYVSTLVEALETTKVLVLPGHEVSRLLDTNSNVRAQVSLSTVERLRQLREFSNLPTCALASLSSRCSHAKFQPGETIFSGSVNEHTPILAVVLGAVELNYPQTLMRKSVRASCLLCTEHFKGKDCPAFTATASAATFVLTLPRDALEDAMCMSPKHKNYVWSSRQSRLKFEERHNTRTLGEKEGVSLLQLSTPQEEDDGRLFRPPDKRFKNVVREASKDTPSNSELSIEPVDSESEDDRFDRYNMRQMTPKPNLPGQVVKSRAKTEILELNEIETSKPKEQPADVVSTAASTPADQLEASEPEPETLHPSPSGPQQHDQPMVARHSVRSVDSRQSLGSMGSVMTMGDDTHVEIGRMKTSNLPNLGRNLGWDGRDMDIKKHKDQAVMARLRPGKSMLDIAQVTDQELDEQEMFENSNIQAADTYGASNVLAGPAASPISNTIRNVRRMSKGACDFNLASLTGPRLSVSEQGNEVTDLEQNQQPLKSSNQLLPPEAHMNRRPSITRTRTPSKQRCEMPSEEQAAGPRSSSKSHNGAGPRSSGAGPRSSSKSHNGEAPKPNAVHTGSQHAAIMVWLGILIDAVPESLVIGILVNRSTTDDDQTAAAAALPFVISVFLSNLPESMSSSGSMKAHGMRVSSILLMWFVTTFLTAIGALIGAVAFPPSTITDESTELVVSGVEGLAAGAMLTMIAQTMMPEAFEQGGDIVGLSCLAGFLCAMTVKLIPV